jgi:hypothetical protein
MSPHSAKDNIAIGSLALWRWARIMECLFVVGVTFFSLLGISFDALSVLFFGMVLFVLAQAHPLAYGFLDQEGLHYRRYLKWRYVRWNQIDSITREPIATIIVNLRVGKILSRRIVLPRNPTLFGSGSPVAGFDEIRTAWLRGMQTIR